MILDTVSGRRYIGSAVRLWNRRRQHFQSLARGDHHSRFMQKTWNKRPEALEFSILLYCDKENLLMYEQILLDAYKPEFNTAPVAGSQLGLKMSDEARAKMSKSRRKDFSPMTGKNHTDETKSKISRAKTGVKMGKYSGERVAKTASAMRASKNALTEDQVRLIRKWNKEGQEHKHSAALLGCSYWVVADVVRNRTFKWVT